MRLFLCLCFFATVAQAQPVRFAVWGDSGVGSAGQKRLARQIAESKPQFLLHTGDLIYPRGQWSGFQPYFWKIYGDLTKTAPFYGALGNHDIMTQNGKPFLQNFKFPRNGPNGITPERNYAFAKGPVLVIVVDSNASAKTMKNRIAPWVGQTLKKSKRDWKIVAFHHPPYSSGLHGGWSRVRKYLAPTLEKYGADVVFNGHDHHYERFKPRNGVVYIVDGAGGGPLYPRKKWQKQTAFFDNKNWSFSAVEATEKRFAVRQIADDGKVLDSWQLQK